MRSPSAGPVAACLSAVALCFDVPAGTVVEATGGTTEELAMVHDGVPLLLARSRITGGIPAVGCGDRPGVEIVRASRTRASSAQGTYWAVQASWATATGSSRRR